MANFLEGLRMSNLYPSMSIPSGGRRNQLFNDFMGMEQGIQGSPMLPRIAEQTAAPVAPQPQAPMNVVYQPSIGDIGREMAFARDVYGVDLNRSALTPYQAGQLSLGGERIAAQREAAQGRQEIAERRLSDAEKNTLIREIRENKNLSDAEKIRLQGEVQAGHITQRGQIESGHIAARGEQERTTEGIRQQGRESLADMQARHRREQIELEAGLKPTGTTRVETVRDAQGNITGARTTKTEQQLPPTAKPGGGNSALMYGPNGEGPYAIPIEKTDDAVARGMSYSKPKGK